VTQPTDRRPSRDAEDPRVRRSWLIFAGSFFALGLISVLRLAMSWARPMDWAVVALLFVVGLAAVRHRLAVQGLEASRRVEAESFARILQGLSRSVSADAIVRAIAEELGTGTGADHVVIVRRHPEASVLEAILVNARSGGSTSSTVFPLSDLTDPPDMTADRGREPIAIAIEVAGPVRAVVGAGVAGGDGQAALTNGMPLTIAASDPRSERRMGGRRSTDPARPGARAAGSAEADDAGGVAAARQDGPMFAGWPRLRPLDPNVAVAERIAARARAVFGLRYTLVAPLTVGGGMVGALLISRRTAGAWPAAAQRLLAGAAVESSAALSRAYSHRQAEAAASTDALTGLPNRRYFDEFCDLLARRRRAEDAVGVLMVDIDRFKSLNDTHGHGVGDEVLRAVAGSIVTAVREDDVPARFGGEEFVVLLRNPTREVAVDVGERVREAVGALDLARFGVPGPVSVSVGVAVADGPGSSIPAVVEAADRALYAAKRAGRDRVVAA
jgi:diguanylate cyclase (GGDEF)-like protein